MVAPSPTDRSDLELFVGEGGAPVELRKLVSASGAFSGLINEVAEAYTGVDHPVRWVVEVKPGSVRLPLRGEPAKDTVRPSATPEIATAVAEGLQRLEREPVRPDYFTDKALEQAKTLGHLLSDEFPLAVRNGIGRVPLTKQLAVNAEKVLGSPRVSYGTVEGSLEALSVHGSGNHVGIWPIDGKRVKCTFGRYVSLEDVLPAVGQRVAARGEIKTRPNGDRVSVEVHSLRILGGAPVAANDVRGIFRDYEVADW